MGEIIAIKGDRVIAFNSIEEAAKCLGICPIEVSEAILHGYGVQGYSFVWSGCIL